MPIRADNRDRYPPNWAEISYSVREAAGFKCEVCGVPDRAWGHRTETGVFHVVPRNSLASGYGRPPFWFGACRIIEIILTVAHLDHQPENCDRSNLRALCQQCHNRHDIPARVAGIRARHREAMQTADIFAGTGWEPKSDSQV